MDWNTPEIVHLELSERKNYLNKLYEDNFETFELPDKQICFKVACNHYSVTPDLMLVQNPLEATPESVYTGLRCLYEETLARKKVTAEVTAEEKPKVDFEAEKQKLCHSMLKTSLNAALQTHKQDFIITSEDSGVFPVHSSLLSELWPFFKTAISSEMSESKTMTLHLPYSKECVQTLVNFFYGVDTSLNWDSAVTLLSISALYDIPELKKLASLYLSCHTKDLTFGRNMKAWKAAHESDAHKIQPLFAQFLKSHVTEIQDSDSAAEYSDSQLVELFCQIVKV